MFLVQDGIPRDCPSAACGAQKDTAIIRDSEFGSVKASPLGRTLGGGPVNPAIVINNFVGAGKQKRSRLPASHRRKILLSVPIKIRLTAPKVAS